jgi:hypothetical protein
MQSKTTLESPSKVKGMLLRFDQVEFSKAEKNAKEIIPAIKKLKNAYSLLELKTPFDSKRLVSFINGTGASEAINEFKEIVKADFKVFTNPISKRETETKINQYADQVHEPLIKVKQLISGFNTLHHYKLKALDFEVNESDVTLKTDDMKKLYSTFLTKSGEEAY